MASQRSSDLAPYLAAPAYGVALLFIVLPILDTFAQVWPPAVGSPSWRYGTVGLGANYLISVLFGMLLGSLIAGWRQHRRTLRWLAIACGVFAVILMIAAISFVLDALELRPGLPRGDATAFRMFDIGAGKAVFKYLVTAVALAWVGLGAWRTGRAIPTATPVDTDVPKLVREQRGS
jgi:hypothetical protein